MSLRLYAYSHNRPDSPVNPHPFPSIKYCAHDHQVRRVLADIDMDESQE